MVRAYVKTNKDKAMRAVTTQALPPSGREDRDATAQRRGPWDHNYTNAGFSMTGAGQGCGCEYECECEERMTGGVMTTKRGVDFVKSRLQARITELNQIQSGQFTPKEPAKAQRPAEESVSQVIYTMLSMINDQITSGVLSEKLMEMLNALLGRILNQGELLEVKDVARILDTVYKFQIDMDATLATPPAGGISAERRRVVRGAKAILQRIQGVLGTLNQYVFASEQEKKLILRALRPETFAMAQAEAPALTAPGGQERATSLEIQRQFGETRPGRTPAGIIGADAEQLATLPIPIGQPQPPEEFGQPAQMGRGRFFF